MAQDRQITLDDVAKGVDQGLTTADTQRAASFERLDMTRKAKDTSLRREHARLSVKYGTDHPRVQAIANKVAINQEFQTQVATETIRAKTEIPLVDENTWVLHGFVRDQAHQGVSNVTVALYDPNGSRLNGLGQACTGANGYFKIISMDANAIAASAAYVRVLSTGGAFLFTDKISLGPALGHVDYKEITLSGATEVCVSPPEPPKGSTTQSGGNWVVSGRVMNTQGQGLKDLLVSIYDRDFIFDDRLGQVGTDLNGYYTLSYRTQDFRDFIERKPDLYLKVLDQQGKILYTSEESVRFEAGRIETINVVIADPSSGSTSPGIPDAWIVNGRVTDAQGKPLAGYGVTLYDKDFFFDDRLGMTTTDDTGFYTLSYKTKNFRDLVESNPDIYVQVMDTEGAVVYTSKGEIRFEAGRIETIDVVVGKR
jgi:protocatechuate 3,4-dioxygenase beta subunit